MTPKKQSALPILSRQMRALEMNAEYFGISLLQLMENAGRNVAAEVACRFPDKKRIVVFCGLGGNGGDGFVAERHLLSLGFHVTVILAGRGRDIGHEAALKNWTERQAETASIPARGIHKLAERVQNRRRRTHRDRL